LTKRQIGNMVPGQKFRTLLTLRDGETLRERIDGVEDPRDDCGIDVRFADGTLKVLHPEIRVQVFP